MIPFVRTRILKLPPPDVPIIPASTPVVSFGDFTQASVASIGLNPSKREFLYSDGTLVDSSARRLSTLDSLGIEKVDEFTDIHVNQIWADCCGYFQRNPFDWFSPLNDLLAEAGASYFNGTGCHLDLSPWATSASWSVLDKKAAKQQNDEVRVSKRKILADDGREFLEQCLQETEFRLLVINGSGVWYELVRNGVIEPIDSEEETMKPEGTTRRIYKGKSRSGVPVVGWSVHWQYGAGEHVFQHRVREVLRSYCSG